MSGTLHQQFRFETLVVGAANRLAATAARAVAEAPGTVYNPLFIYARPGLGKTHLLMAMGHAALAIDPRLVVEYLTVDAFLESFAGAMAAGQGEAHRRRFLDVGLLLLDDVQFLSQHREMQAELIRLIDILQTSGRQIVLTSDRPPAEIDGLDERLIRRFAGGLAIDILAPDYETRVAILRRRADDRAVTFAPGVVEAVAALDIDNVRELIGALNRLVAFQAASDRPLDAMQARVLLGGADAPDAAHSALVSAVDSVSAGPDSQSLPGVPEAPAEPVVVRDEFADFLSEVSATVSQQVESWRTRVAEAVLRWEGEGYRTARLERLLAEMSWPIRTRCFGVRGGCGTAARGCGGGRRAVARAGRLAGPRRSRRRGCRRGAPRARPAGRQPAAGAVAALEAGDVSRGGLQPHGGAARRKPSCPMPAAQYNPFVIVGASGVGKTHLLHGLGNALAAGGGLVACLERARVHWTSSSTRSTATPSAPGGRDTGPSTPFCSTMCTWSPRRTAPRTSCSSCSICLPNRAADDLHLRRSPRRPGRASRPGF